MGTSSPCTSMSCNNNERTKCSNNFQSLVVSRVMVQDQSLALCKSIIKSLQYTKANLSPFVALVWYNCPTHSLLGPSMAHSIHPTCLIATSFALALSSLCCRIVLPPRAPTQRSCQYPHLAHHHLPSWLTLASPSNPFTLPLPLYNPRLHTRPTLPTLPVVATLLSDLPLAYHTCIPWEDNLRPPKCGS